MYDIGAGTGSVSMKSRVQVSRSVCMRLRKNPEGVELIDQNRKKFRTDGVRIV